MTTDQVDVRQVLATALVTAVDHVGIAVPDLDAAITWYHDHLGMIVLHEEINDDQGIREAMLSVRGAPVGSAQVQLMAPLDDSSTIAKFIDKRGPGIQQLAYRVSDLESLTDRLREQGVRLLYGAPRRGTANSRINFIHPKDAGGVLIELVEPAGDADAALKRAARFGSGWWPFLSKVEDVPARIDFIKSQPTYDGRPFDVMYPLGMGRVGEGHVTTDDPNYRPGMGKQEIVDQLCRFAELGVTFSSVPAPRVNGPDAYLDFAQWVIEEIKPHVTGACAD